MESTNDFRIKKTCEFILREINNKKTVLSSLSVEFVDQINQLTEFIDLLNTIIEMIEFYNIKAVNHISNLRKGDELEIDTLIDIVISMLTPINSNLSLIDSFAIKLLDSNIKSKPAIFRYSTTIYDLIENIKIESKPTLIIFDLDSLIANYENIVGKLETQIDLKIESRIRNMIDNAIKTSHLTKLNTDKIIPSNLSRLVKLNSHWNRMVIITTTKQNLNDVSGTAQFIKMIIPEISIIGINNDHTSDDFQSIIRIRGARILHVINFHLTGHLTDHLTDYEKIRTRFERCHDLDKIHIYNADLTTQIQATVYQKLIK